MPVQYLVEYVTLNDNYQAFPRRNIYSLIPENIIQLPPYSDEFKFNVQGMIKGRIVNKHYFFVRTEPRFLNAAAIGFNLVTGALTSGLYKLGMHQFKVAFTL